jgi:hypothetical protein
LNPPAGILMPGSRSPGFFFHQALPHRFSLALLSDHVDLDLHLDLPLLHHLLVRRCLVA